jgi:hypothetical protein
MTPSIQHFMDQSILSDAAADMPAMIKGGQLCAAATAAAPFILPASAADLAPPTPPHPEPAARPIAPGIWDAAPCDPLFAPLSAREEALEGGAVAETLPSTEWPPALVARLSSALVRDRNRFVCLQLATMAAEQLEAAARARREGDRAALARAATVFLSTLEVGGELVGAALHYPRAASKAAAPGVVIPQQQTSLQGGGEGEGACGGGVFPHVYVELICINQPGRGYGSVLLQHGAYGGRGRGDSGCRDPSTSAKIDAGAAVAAAGGTQILQPPSLADPPPLAPRPPSPRHSRGLCPLQRRAPAARRPRRRGGRHRHHQPHRNPRRRRRRLPSRVHHLPPRHQAALSRVGPKVLRGKRLLGAGRMPRDVQAAGGDPARAAARGAGALMRRARRGRKRVSNESTLAVAEAVRLAAGGSGGPLQFVGSSISIHMIASHFLYRTARATFWTAVADLG